MRSSRIWGFALSILLSFLSPSQALCQYSPQDSIALYQLLERADDADFAGRMEEALEIVNRVIVKSQLLGMTRSLGYAYLKKADLLLKQSDYKDLPLYYNLGLQTGLKLQDSLMTGLAYHQTSQYYKEISDYSKAIEALQNAKVHYAQQTDLLYQGMVQNDLALIHSLQGNYELSVEHNLNAVKIFDKIGEEKEKSNSLSNLGICFFRLDDKKQAIKYFLEAFTIQKNLGDTKRIASTAGNLATVYSGINLDSAVVFQKIQIEATKQLQLKSAQAFALSNLANLQYKKSDFHAALESYQQANLMYHELGNANKLIQNHLRLAQVLDHLNDSIQAERHFEKAYSLALEKMLKPMLQNYFETKSSFYKHRNNYALAYDHYEKSVALKDSILDEKSRDKIAELNVQYETEKKQLQIAKLEAQRIQNQLTVERQMGLIRINEIKVLKRQKEIELLKKDQELQTAKLHEASMEHDKQALQNSNQQKNIKLLETTNALNAKIIQNKENRFRILILFSIAGILFFLLAFNRLQLKKQLHEQKVLFEVRNKIAKDLHDDIGSTLTSITILSQVSAKNMEHQPAKAMEMIQSVAEQSRKIQQNMSDIVWAIRPDNEKMEAMAHRIQEYCSKTLEPLDIQYTFDVNEDILRQVIPIQCRKEFILIAKELINNIVKHSKASKVSISLAPQGQYILLSIKDNGMWKGDEKSTGTGLKSIHERAMSIGGNFELKHNQFGTEANIKIPLT